MDELTALRTFVLSRLAEIKLEDDYAGYYAAVDAYHETLTHIDGLLAARSPTDS